MNHSFALASVHLLFSPSPYNFLSAFKMKTVLGKRARRDSNSTVASACSKVTVSELEDSPLAKRQRTCLGEGSDANKENIPPLADLSVSPPRPIVTEVGAARGRRRTTVNSAPPTASKDFTQKLLLHLLTSFLILSDFNLRVF